MPSLWLLCPLKHKATLIRRKKSLIPFSGSSCSSKRISAPIYSNIQMRSRQYVRMESDTVLIMEFFACSPVGSIVTLKSASAGFFRGSCANHSLHPADPSAPSDGYILLVHRQDERTAAGFLTEILGAGYAADQIAKAALGGQLAVRSDEEVRIAARVPARLARSTDSLRVQHLQHLVGHCTIDPYIEYLQPPGTA